MRMAASSKLAAAAAAATALAVVASPRLSLMVCAACRRVLQKAELASLRQLAAAQKKRPGQPWFAGLQQQLTSAATNTVDTDPAAYTGPTVYQGEHDLPLPYPPIADDTEAISGFVDLVKLKLAKPGELVLNLGGGAFDGGPRWLEQQVPGVRVLTADPFRRSAAHNTKVQAFVEGEGGAHVVASISVLVSSRRTIEPALSLQETPSHHARPSLATHRMSLPRWATASSTLRWRTRRCGRAARPTSKCGAAVGPSAGTVSERRTWHVRPTRRCAGQTPISPR